MLERGELARALAGREAGHALAPIVETGTRTVLARHFAVHEALHADGSAVVRDIADLWLGCEGLEHPVNVKCRILRRRATGRPNMVSLVRLLKAVAAGSIDAYYVLVVALAADGHSVEVRFGNLLAHLDLVAFDAGTGQVMATPDFFTAIDGAPCRGDLAAVPHQLLELYEDGVRRLHENRQATLAELRSLVAAGPSLPPPNRLVAAKRREEQLSLWG